MSKVLRSFAFVPGFWTRVALAEAKDPLEQSSWERGLAMVARQYDSPRSPVWAVQAILAGATGVPIGNAVAVNSWGLQVLVGGAAGLTVFWALPVALAGIFAVIPAPIRQRNEAREYVRALKTNAHDYAEWARRCGIAYDFRHETLEDFRRLAEEEPRLMGSVSYEEERWRTKVAYIRSLMQEHGADASVLALLDRQMGAFDSEKDVWGDNQLGWIRQSMSATCQNLWSEVVRKQGPPTPPTPPEGGSDQ